MSLTNSSILIGQMLVACRVIIVIVIITRKGFLCGVFLVIVMMTSCDSNNVVTVSS